MAETWVVLLEVEGGGAGGGMSRADAAALLAALQPGPYGTGLYSHDRYAVQVTVRAAGPIEALSSVLTRWNEAVRRMGLPPWRIVRTEVLTVAEFERDLDQADGAADPGPGPIPLSAHGPDDDLAQKLLRDALSDPVTGLLGRDAFEHLLGAALATASGHRGVAVACVHLEVGALEERLGPAAGDQIRLSMAERLAGTVRPDDALARVGGDVFAAVLTDTPAETAMAVAGRMLDAVRRPLTLPGLDFTVPARAGVALGEPGEEAATVLARAEAAMAAGAATAAPFGSGEGARSDLRPGPRNGAANDPLARVPESPARWWQRRQEPGRPPPRS